MAEFFLILEKSKHVQLEGDVWFWSKAFLFTMMAWDKNWVILILYEKYWMSSCTTCLIRNSNIPMSLAMDLINLLRSLSVMDWSSTTNSEILFFQERSEWVFWTSVTS